MDSLTDYIDEKDHALGLLVFEYEQMVEAMRAYSSIPGIAEWITRIDGARYGFVRDRQEARWLGSEQQPNP